MRTILIVDDEPKICRLLKQFFELRGCQALTTTSGEEALAVVRIQRPDYVLLDVRMPEMSGLEVLERLKASDPKIPVIMVSAAADGQTIEAAMHLGASDYITKPMDFREASWARAFFADL